MSVPSVLPTVVPTAVPFVPAQEVGTSAGTCSNFTQSVKDGVSWVGNKAYSFGSSICTTLRETAHSISEWAKPRLADLSKFVGENQVPIIAGVVCLAIGSIVTALFCKCMEDEAPTQMPAQTQTAPAGM